MTMQLGIESNYRREIAPVIAMREERLPFRINVVTDEAQLAKAVQIRHSAYARHVPEFARQLSAPEERDHAAGTVVLLAESKLDGSALGTMRIQTNQLSPLGLEQSVTLPEWLRGRSLAEATRLGISEGREGRLVKTALFKAYFQYCKRAEIDWMVITARRPLDRQYEALLFCDAFAAGEYIPMRHVGNIPHRVMAFDVGNAEERWIAAAHPLYGFMCQTHHPDINVDGGFVDELPAFFVPESARARTTMKAFA